MSYYHNFMHSTSITIPKFVVQNGVVFYDINVKVKHYEWLVQRRYKDFFELHEKLVNEQSLSKKLLPPKKVIGNRNPAFLDQRRKDLEEYLQKLLTILRVSIPRSFAEFLEFNKYDINFLLQDLAKYFCECGNAILSISKEYNFTSLDLHAISERMGLPCPFAENQDSFDFSHVLDFCDHLESISIMPTKASYEMGNDYNSVDVPIGRSNIIPNKLPFHLNAFHCLKTLKIYGISPESLTDVSLLKRTLSSIYVHNTTISKINQVLFCDNIHKNAEIDAIAVWDALEYINVSGNLLTDFDQSIKIAPHLKTLIADQNRVKQIKFLNFLPELRSLSLCENIITECSNWHIELGNLVTLNLSQNKLKSLFGLRKMYSLVNLDLSNNLIEDIEEIDNLSHLPLLENLRLMGNPISETVDYRARVLARFNERAIELVLDNEKGSAKELDTALVLSALRQSNINCTN